MTSVSETLSSTLATFFFSYLRKHSASTFDPMGPDITDQCDNALMAFCSFLSIHHFTKQNCFASQRCPSLLHLWPDLLPWIAYYAEIISNRTRKLNYDSERIVFTALASFICVYVRDLYLQQKWPVGQTSSFLLVEVAVLLWKREDEFTSLETRLLPTKLLHRILYLSSPIYSTLDVLAMRLDGVENVARLAMARLQSCTKAPDTSQMQLEAYMKILFRLQLLSSGRNQRSHPLQTALFDLNPTPVIVAAVDTLSSKKNMGHTAVITLEQAFVFFFSMHNGGDGIFRLEQSISGGLLHAFVRCARHFARFSPLNFAVAMSILEVQIPTALMYLSILRVTKTFIQIFSSPDTVKTMESSLARKSWFALHIFVLQQSYLRQAVKFRPALCDQVSSRFSIYSRNSNVNVTPKCGSRKLAKDLMRCSRCHTSRYCSKLCQCLAWEKDHRETCRILRAISQST